ncbi:hypothetical protein Tco_1271955 [Tanacetum coccineum]
MYYDYIGGQLSDALRTTPAAPVNLNLQTTNASTTIAKSAPTPTNSSSLSPNIPNTLQDVDELPQQQHVQQPDDQAQLQSKVVADNVHNARYEENKFVNPFAPPSTSDVESSSSQYDHPLKQVIGEPSRPVLTRNQLQTDGDMCIYAFSVSTMESHNVKEAMPDPGSIDSMQEELL